MHLMNRLRMFFSVFVFVVFVNFASGTTVYFLNSTENTTELKNETKILSPTTERIPLFSELLEKIRQLQLKIEDLQLQASKRIPTPSERCGSVINSTNFQIILG